jgi:hypothetical protein
MLKEDEQLIVVTNAESLLRFPVSRSVALQTHQEHSRKVALFEFAR